ncbi:Hypothetical protein KVN_LOCUS26 [uncultured virus]|nr:Hypothetical protein KVN_LOCUS26 [uncultured virus]
METICEKCMEENKTIPHKKCNQCSKNIKVFQEPCFGKSNFVKYFDSSKKNREELSNTCLECHNKDNNFICEYCQKSKPVYDPNIIKPGNIKLSWQFKIELNEDNKINIKIVCKECYFFIKEKNKQEKFKDVKNLVPQKILLSEPKDL